MWNWKDLHGYFERFNISWRFGERLFQFQRKKDAPVWRNGKALANPGDVTPTRG